MAIESDSWCAHPPALWTDKGLGWGWLGCCSLLSVYWWYRLLHVWWKPFHLFPIVTFASDLCRVDQKTIFLLLSNTENNVVCNVYYIVYFDATPAAVPDLQDRVFDNACFADHLCCTALRDVSTYISNHRTYNHVSLRHSWWTHRYGCCTDSYLQLFNFLFYFLFYFTTVLSHWDFTHGKYGLLSPGKASCDRFALLCTLGVLVFT